MLHNCAKEKKSKWKLNLIVDSSWVEDFNGKRRMNRDSISCGTYQMSIESWKDRLGWRENPPQIIMLSSSLSLSLSILLFLILKLLSLFVFFLYSIVNLKWKIFKWRLFTIVDCDRNAVKRAGIFNRETNWIIKENRVFKLRRNQQSESSGNQLLPKIGLFYRQQTTKFPSSASPTFFIISRKKFKEIQKINHK